MAVPATTRDQNGGNGTGNRPRINTNEHEFVKFVAAQTGRRRTFSRESPTAVPATTKDENAGLGRSGTLYAICRLDMIMIDTKTPIGRGSGGGFGHTVQLGDGTPGAAYSYWPEEDRRPK